MTLYQTRDEEREFRKNARSQNISNVGATEVPCPTHGGDSCIRCGGFGTIGLFNPNTFNVLQQLRQATQATQAGD